ncbi:MAG: peroxidase-related enzyme [Actinomycetota bacterium]|nr:peroxidase-related enzyme [Actinomycetota bacterium]
MTFIETIDEKEATGPAAALYEEDRADKGYVSNYSRLFAHRPDVYEAWSALSGSIKTAMGLRRYELATLAAARTLKSSYCSLAHGKVLRDKFLGTEQLVAVIDHRNTSELPPDEVAIMDFAEKVAADASSITASDIERLRQHGLGEADILDVALAAAARSFFSKVLDAMGVKPDPAFRELEPELQSLLTVGRPIAAS